MEKKRVIDIEEGIFETMFNHYSDTINWLSLIQSDTTYTPSDVDSAYSFHSGEKILSRAIASKIDDINTISDYIYNMYYKKWNRVFETLELDYNPIESDYFEREETGHDSKLASGESTATGTNKGDNRIDYSTRNNLTSSGDNTEKVFAFNSVDGVRNSLGDSENSKDEITNVTNIDNTKTTTTSQALNKDKEYSDNIVNEKYKGRRGVNPTTLLEDELTFRKHLFLDIVFDDVDKLITIGVY